MNRPPRTRFTGALLGGAIGDALGAPVEGWEPDQIRQVFGRLERFEAGAGNITDDTQLTMCVGECYVAQGWLDPVDLSRRLVEWLPHARGPGSTTVAAVRRLQAGALWLRAGENSAGNGAAIRAAPIGLVRWNDPILLRAEATLVALPTHSHPMAVAGAVAMAAATAFLVVSRPGHWTVHDFIRSIQSAIAGIEVEPLAERRDAGSRTTLYDRIGEIPGLLAAPPSQAFAYLCNGGFVLESLPSALYCFLRSRHDLEEMLSIAVNAGHDADSVAAMAGTLGGALGGIQALPPDLLARLEYRKYLTELAGSLHALAAPNHAGNSG